MGPTSRECSARTSTLPTTSIRGCISAAGFISCVMGMISKNSIPRMWWCGSGSARSKRSTNGHSPTRVLIPACLQPSKRQLVVSNNTSSSRSCGTSVRLLRIPLRPCTLSASGSSASYPNCSSSWPDLGFRQITIWRSAACDRWSLRAKLVVDRAAPRGPRRAWHSSVASARGPLRVSILSCTVWLCFPNKPIRLRVNNFSTSSR